MHTRFLFRLAGLVLLSLGGAACASTEGSAETGEAVDEVTTTDVNACRGGGSLAVIATDNFYWQVEGAYASTGLQIDVDPIFNGWEFGYTVRARGAGNHEVDPESLEGCGGSVRIGANARIFAGPDDPDCKPGTAQEITCEVKNGVTIHVVVAALEPMHGFAVARERLRIRTGPTEAHEILGVIPKGGIVRRTGEYTNEFTSVAFGEMTGFSSNEFLRTLQGTAVTKERLRIRQFESLRAPILTVIPKGSTVKLTGSGAGQFVVAEFNGIQGYVAGDQLKDPVAEGM